MYLEAVELTEDDIKLYMVVSTPIISFAAAARKPKLASSFDMLTMCTGCECNVLGGSGADGG